MKAAILVFPGSNCDRDLKIAFEKAGAQVSMVWHKDDALPEGTDIVGVPGGFSYGDYLRCGAIAANSPITRSLKAHVERGGYALGICNGFQILTETRILPGALLRNANLKYICRTVPLTVRTADSDFTRSWKSASSCRSRSPTTTATTRPTPSCARSWKAKTASRLPMTRIPMARPGISPGCSARTAGCWA